jgi:hypothetical protein
MLKTKIKSSNYDQLVFPLNPDPCTLVSVHEYARLDLTIIYSVLQNRLGDFHRYIEYIKRYLETTP